MKKFILLFLTLTITTLYGQNQWSIVGNAGLVDTFAVSPIISISPNGIPYIGFAGGQKGAAHVMKFDGSSWVDVGAPNFSTGQILGMSLAFDENETPYVAYSDATNCYKITVMKFDGSSWIVVGASGFSQGVGSFATLTFDNNGIPYVAFRDQGACVYSSWPNGFRASVMKFDGSNWVYVGAPGFSTLGGSADGASYTYICFDNNNTPYISYNDNASGFNATVQKFDGTNWLYVGVPGFAAWNATTSRSLTFDNSGTPFIVCSIAGKAAVMKFDGSSWLQVGPGVSSGYSSVTSLAFDSMDSLYVAFKDNSESKKATVMKFDGSNWNVVGTAGFTAGEVNQLNFVIAPNNDLYVAFRDCSAHDCNYPTVMKYANNTVNINSVSSVGLFNIYPNPSHEIFNIQYENNNVNRSLQLTVSTVQGKSVYSETINNFSGKINKQINLKSLARGVYFFQLSSEKTKEFKKIIIE